MTNEVGSELALVEVPDLNEAIPTGRHDQGSVKVGREADAGDPLLVAILSDGELALTEGVPQVNGAITRAGDDLSVVGRESDGENVLGVTNESSSGQTSVEVPQAESAVPGAGQGILTIRGDGDVLNEV